MSQELPKPKDLEGSQQAPASRSESNLQETSQEVQSSNSKDILDGATSFARILHKDERLVGGILISLPIVLIAIIPFTPENQRLTLTCVTLGSVLVSSLLIFLLFKTKQKLERETTMKNRELKVTNDKLERYKANLEREMLNLRHELRDSTREKRSILFKLKDQIDQVEAQTEVLLQGQDISKNSIQEVNQNLKDVVQQIQDLLNFLNKTQGGISDAEDLNAVDRSFDRELRERFEQSQKHQEQ